MRITGPEEGDGSSIFFRLLRHYLDIVLCITMADKQIKVLEKLLAQEAKADEQKVQRAVKEMQKAEKAYQRSVKVFILFSNVDIPTEGLILQETEKAVKAHQKAGEQKLKAAKALNSAEKKFNDAAANREKAERKTTVRMNVSLLR